MKSDGIFILEYNENKYMHHGIFSLQYKGNILCKLSRHAYHAVGPFFYKIVDVHHRDRFSMDLAQMVEMKVYWKVWEEKLENTYPQVVE